MTVTFPAMNLPRLCQLIQRGHGRHRNILSRCVHPVKASHSGWLYSNFGHRFLFTHNAETYVKLKEKELDVNPGFGVLHVTGTIDFLIKPTNVQVRILPYTAFLNLMTGVI